MSLFSYGKNNKNLDKNENYSKYHIRSSKLHDFKNLNVMPYVLRNQLNTHKMNNRPQYKRNYHSNQTRASKVSFQTDKVDNQAESIVESILLNANAIKLTPKKHKSQTISNPNSKSSSYHDLLKNLLWQMSEDTDKLNQYISKIRRI